MANHYFPASLGQKALESSTFAWRPISTNPTPGLRGAEVGRGDRCGILAVSGNAEVEWIYVECDEEAPAHGRGKTKGKHESDIKGIVSPAAMDNLRDKYEEMGMVYVESDTKYTLVTAQGNSARPYITAGDYRFYLCGLRGKLAYCDLIDFAVEFPGFCAVGMISVADKFDKEHVRKGVGGFEGQKSGPPNSKMTQSWAAAHFKSTFSRGKPFLRSDDGQLHFSSHPRVRGDHDNMVESLIEQLEEFSVRPVARVAIPSRAQLVALGVVGNVTDVSVSPVFQPGNSTSTLARNSSSAPHQYTHGVAATPPPADAVASTSTAAVEAPPPCSG